MAVSSTRAAAGDGSEGWFSLSRPQGSGSFACRGNHQRAARWRLSRTDAGRTRRSNCGRRPNANCLAYGGDYRARRECVHREWPAVLNAAHRATRTIPIVALDLETDPVANGLAVALARPGGNVTGVFLDFPDFTTKWIELLVECNPKLSRIAVLWDPTTGSVQMESVKKAAELLKLQLDISEVRGASNFDEAFSGASQRSAGAMVLLSSPVIAPNVQMLAELAIRHRLPAITLFPDFARVGGLLAYGPNLLGIYRRTGVLAAKVLAGAKPAELPIERPTKFELVLNMRTATALNLSVPASLLLRADEVIE